MGSRKQNEGKFESWAPLRGGGRRYRLEIHGKAGWKAIYLKEVDASEATVRFWQEIYDDAGKLRATHEKFPLDTGHRKV
jgi:hypothetical protein